MAYLVLLRLTEDHLHLPQLNKYEIVDKIRVNSSFLYCYNLSENDYDFFDIHSWYYATTGDLLKWIHEQHKNELKQGFSPTKKYQTEPRVFCKEKVLPKIKKWDRNLYVQIWDYL